MKLTSKGQVTIPRALREQFGLQPQTEVSFEPAPGGVLIKPAAADRRRRLQAWLRRARGSTTTKLSTDDIMRLTRGEK
ncbi:MAG: AbrB/MazE/SpoVT family DNA-binding domain-containing protein [Limisphaerales bacterium]